MLKSRSATYAPKQAHGGPKRRPARVRSDLGGVKLRTACCGAALSASGLWITRVRRYRLALLSRPRHGLTGAEKLLWTKFLRRASLSIRGILAGATRAG